MKHQYKNIKIYCGKLPKIVTLIMNKLLEAGYEWPYYYNEVNRKRWQERLNIIYTFNGYVNFKDYPLYTRIDNPDFSKHMMPHEKNACTELSLPCICKKVSLKEMLFNPKEFFMNKKIIIGILITAISSNVYALNWGNIIQHGYVEGYFFPKHHEYDVNPGIPFESRYVSRYAIDVYDQIRYSKIDKLFVFIDAFSFFGNTRPQIDYNYNAYPIVSIFTYGIGYDINSKFTIKISTSKHSSLGNKYHGERLLWSGISLRYKW